MADDFAVHLGGGAYLDSSGNFTFQPNLDAVLLEAPPGFRLDLKKFQDTFKDLAAVLPATKDDEAKWKEWGFPAQAVTAIMSIAKVTGLVAGVISVYFWAVAALAALMEAFMEEKLPAKMEKAFEDLKAMGMGEEQIRLTDKVVELLAPFGAKIESMNGLVNSLKASGPVGPTSLPIYQQLHGLINDLDTPLAELCSEQ